MLEWPAGVEPEYETGRDTKLFASYVRTETDKHGQSLKRGIAGWIVKPPPGAPPKSRWVIDLQSGCCTCEETDSDADDSDDEHDCRPVPQFVPPDFKRTPVPLALLDYYIPLSRETLAKLKHAGAVEAGKVVYKYARPFYLTKRELMEIPPGELVKVYVFDRNWGDSAFEGKEPGKKTTFRQFFEPVLGTMSRNESGDKLTLTWGGDPYPYTLDTEINYAKHSWYPMTDGVLPAREPRSLFKLLGKRVQWKDIKPETNVGYRGPIILAKYANKMPKFVYRKW